VVIGEYYSPRTTTSTRRPSRNFPESRLQENLSSRREIIRLNVQPLCTDNFSADLLFGSIRKLLVERKTDCVDGNVLLCRRVLEEGPLKDRNNMSQSQDRAKYMTINMPLHERERIH
jgi:hypothetical protein